LKKTTTLEDANEDMPASTEADNLELLSVGAIPLEHNSNGLNNYSPEQCCMEGSISKAYQEMLGVTLLTGKPHWQMVSFHATKCMMPWQRKVLSDLLQSDGRNKQCKMTFFK
jgi:ribonucleotide monophosphatase NagD (HAD superfamily)